MRTDAHDDGGGAVLPLLAGVALAIGLVLDGRAQANVEDVDPARVPAHFRRELPADVDQWSARELRLLPGLGQARALQIVRARWEDGLRGGPARWSILHGIGPATVAAAQRELERRELERRAASVEGSRSVPYTRASVPP